MCFHLSKDGDIIHQLLPSSTFKGVQNMRLPPCLGRNLIAALLLCLFSTAAFGQAERGTVTGTVTDPSGSVVPNAKISVVNDATNVVYGTVTSSSGLFHAPNLPPGKYSVRVEAAGFRAAKVDNVDVDAASTARVDVKLEVGSAQQTIEVTSQAVVLQTDSATSSTNISNKLMSDLPVVVGGAMRSPFGLAILTPESKDYGDNNFQMGGGQAASYGTTLDGISANTTRALTQSWVAVNTPSMDAITEFSTETNGYKAEFGHAGGGQMTFVSKSGGNQFHGSAYEYLRNTNLDARNFFQKTRSVYKQNDFGATVGGPVIIPKVWNGKDKAFFFFSYEGFRNRVGSTSAFTTVPTQEMYNGDFSKWVDKNGLMIPIFDPFSLHKDANGNNVRDPYPNNQMDPSKFDPLSVKALGVYQQYGGGKLVGNTGAAPGTIGYVTNNYVIANGSEVSPANKYSVRGDYNLGSKDHFSGYIGWNRTGSNPGSGGPATLPGFYSTYNNLSRNSDVYRFSWNRTFTPTIINAFYAGANDWKENHDPLQSTKLSGVNWKDKICMPNVPNCDENLTNIRFDSNGYGGWGGQANNGSENLIIAFNDDATIIKGAHTIKFGGMMQWAQYNGFGRQDIAGQATFNFSGTGRPGDTNFNTAGGNPFASFLLGWANNGGVDTVRYIAQIWRYFAGYIQDDWRAARNFTLFYGVRWENTAPAMEADNRWSDLDPNMPNPGAGGIPGALIYAGTGPGRQGTRTLSDSWYGGFGPRFGFAWNLNEKTVIRANVARSFSAVTTTTGSTHQKGFTQTTSFPNAANGVTPSFFYREGLPYYPIPPFISPSFQNGADMPWWQGGEVSRLPEQNSWNFSIQRQFKQSYIVEASYNAVAGSHLQAGLLNYNQVPFSALEKYGATLLNSNILSPAAVAAGFREPFPGFVKLFGTRATVAQSLRRFPQYTSIDTWSGNGDHSGHSNYQAFVVKLDKRFSNNLIFTTSYVFSKILTNADTYWITDNPRAADQNNRGLEKSIGSYDATHYFKFAGSYNLPFGKGQKWANSSKAADIAIGGWQLSYIGLYASGRPVGLGTSVSVPLFAGRAVPWVPTYENWRGAVAGDKFDPAVDSFYQPKAFFGPQPNNTIGNSTRFNPLTREFPAYTENFSVSKQFNVKEGMYFQIMGQAFNAFNRVRFATGDSNLGSSTFGKVTSQLNDPRRMQVAARFIF
jgi:hypothetical protein